MDVKISCFLGVLCEIGKLGYEIKALVKKEEKKPNRPKSEGACLYMFLPIYVFHDSEQKVEFKARIKPCSHQPNCRKF